MCNFLSKALHYIASRFNTYILTMHVICVCRDKSLHEWDHHHELVVITMYECVPTTNSLEQKKELALVESSCTISRIMAIHKRYVEGLQKHVLMIWGRTWVWWFHTGWVHACAGGSNLDSLRFRTWSDSSHICPPISIQRVSLVHWLQMWNSLRFRC